MRELRPESVKYQIIECIGEGETAAVYRAFREDSRGHSRQTVALKILKDRTAVSRMRREFDALTRVNSPHCVRLLAWENLPEGAALVLEWVDGISLLQLAKARRLRPQLIDEVLAQIQYGLKAIHELSLVHGDLSPSNVMIDRRGNVRLLDFGMPLVNAGELRGTPAFMAPEVWAGDEPRAQSDLFSLGLMAFDLATGFGTSPQSMEKCRLRSENFATEHQSLMSRHPNRRQFLPIESSQTAKVEIAALVSSILDDRESFLVRTHALSNLEKASEIKIPARNRHLIWMRQYAFAICMAIVATAAPGAADAPANLDSNKRGEIEIRAERWLEISINGKSIGYAPVALSGVQPGNHRIQWRGSDGNGEVRVVVSAGSKLVLNEKALRLGQIPRNR